MQLQISIMIFDYGNFEGLFMNDYCIILYALSDIVILHPVLTYCIIIRPNMNMMPHNPFHSIKIHQDFLNLVMHAFGFRRLHRIR